MTHGLTPSLAAGVYATLNASSLVTRFAVPIAADYHRQQKGHGVLFLHADLPDTAPSSLCRMPGRSSLCYPVRHCVGGEVPIFPVISRQYYGHAPMSSLYGWQNIGNGVGMALGQPSGDSSGPRPAITLAYCSCRLLRAWPGCCPSSSCPAPPAACCRAEEQLPPEARSAEAEVLRRDDGDGGTQGTDDAAYSRQDRFHRGDLCSPAGKSLACPSSGSGKWLPLGGHIELDEDPEQAALREAREESGLTLNCSAHGPTTEPGTRALLAPRFLDIHRISATHEHIGMIYFARPRHASAALQLAATEHHAIRWCTYEESAGLSPAQWAIQWYCEQAIRESVTPCRAWVASR